MAHPEEFENFEPFPLKPRVRSFGSGEGAATHPDLETVPDSPLGEIGEISKRHFIPITSKKVEYWSQGEKATAWKSGKKFIRKPHAKRANQMTTLLLIIAMIVLVIFGVSIYRSDRQYSHLKHKDSETLSPVLDFYLANHAIATSEATEKKKKDVGVHQVHGLSTVDDNLEIPISDQLNSMNTEIQRMRDAKKVDESPPPTDPVVQPNPLDHLTPTKSENFQAPQNFDKTLPKVLQGTN